MVDYTCLIYEVKDFVCTVTLNRPAKRNALSAQLVNELIYAFECAEADDDVRVVILTGSGHAFCAGGDLSQMSGASSGGDSDVPYRGGFVELNLTLGRLKKPVIAKVRRYALAGGLGLVCACHFAFAEDVATFGTPEIQRGLFPMMIMANIFRVVPKRKGLELILTGERISADDALDMGMISHVSTVEGLDADVWSFAQTLVDRPPAVMKLGLEAYHTQSDMDYVDALPYLNTMLMKCLETTDAQKGLMAFMSKQTPNWRTSD
ncbi:MAG: enoyl-CoA hydratase/isomerase family protein [Myxococcota bacterium]|nr:enoyl-CoA hydratase/isomerase family protein [Myxococcota bacterium]